MIRNIKVLSIRELMMICIIICLTLISVHYYNSYNDYRYNCGATHTSIEELNEYLNRADSLEKVIDSLNVEKENLIKAYAGYEEALKQTEF